eukprot:CAMPEP_0185185122 /NCGR_PEP_ID=MMETSP1140-20130426/3031_1 /TAXON_ID=298111 /ORGANISM="Pavlova sp., Strain CCMP459" /LENGTH=80 /DNA_ID=CAMNT_0027751251 /DNA_START=237 /DNA_END=475 /DNA_ORIENTATION=-
MTDADLRSAQSPEPQVSHKIARAPTPPATVRMPARPVRRQIGSRPRRRSNESVANYARYMASRAPERAAAAEDAALADAP